MLLPKIGGPEKPGAKQDKAKQGNMKEEKAKENN